MFHQLLKAFRSTGVVLAIAGCGTFHVILHPAGDPSPTGSTLVGAARVEITPPAGFPMGGYGGDGQLSRGFWIRLYARAIYLEDAAGQSIVLVSTDLWSMPGGLADRVAELVQKKCGGTTLGRSQIILAATHTHQSPAAFSTSIAYNALSSPRALFDRNLFEFLAERISTAILDAKEDSGPGRVFWKSEVLDGLFRNRAMRPFEENPSAEQEQILKAHGSRRLCEFGMAGYDRRACLAVDPTLTVLRLERQGKVIGAAAFVAAHPTSVGMPLAVYSADVFGVAALEARRAIGAANGDGHAPVVAIFNGAEGDVSFNWVRQSGDAVISLGRRLGGAIAQTARGGNVANVELEHRFGRFSLSRGCFEDEEGERLCTSRHALIGRGTPAGAPDGRTQMHGWIWRDGVTRTPHGPHGGKTPALDPGFWWLRVPLTRLIFGLVLRGPESVPLGVYRIGPLTLATLPGEFTTTMGRRIRLSVADKFHPKPERVLLVGLANEYVSYFATPEEYTAQFYEGSSTVYGKHAGALVQSYLSKLASQFGDGAPRTEAPERRSYVPGWSLRSSTKVEPSAFSSDAGLEPLLKPLPYSERGAPFPSVCWSQTDSRWDLSNPRVQVEIQQGGQWQPLWLDGRPQDNFGDRVVTLTSSDGKGQSEWRAVWLPPRTPAIPHLLRFVVTPRSGDRLTSPGFRLYERFAGGRCWGVATDE